MACNKWKFLLLAVRLMEKKDHSKEKVDIRVRYILKIEKDAAWVALWDVRDFHL